MINSVRARSGEVLFGPFRLVAAERLLTKEGVPVNIGGRAIDVLIALIGRNGAIISGRELVDIVWPDVTVEEANLRVHIAALRRALDDGRDGSRYIVNVPGRGYCFVAPLLRSASEAPSATPNTTPLPQKIPQLPDTLLGRSETTAALISLVLSRRFVSVIGPGGIGKTSVALAVGEEMLQEFGENGVCFVDLSSLIDSADVPRAIASSLGCLVQGPDPEPYIRAFVAGKRLLIILDSCEHIVEAAASAAERLSAASEGVHILATSREALRAQGENVHFLMPLKCPPEDRPSVAQALAAPAVQLFMKRAISSGYQIELNDTDASIVTSICRRLDGVALAIELVASRVGNYGIGGTAELLDRGDELMLQGRRNALPRHQSLQAMLDWSYKLLPTNEQKILRRLSVFVGSFTLAAAQSVAGDPDEKYSFSNAVTNLSDKSLIWISSRDGQVQYRLFDTTRDYAEARLAETGEQNETARRHARHFADFLAAAATSNKPAFDGRHVSDFASHLGNVRKALAWSFSTKGDAALGIELATHAAPLLLDLSAFAECLVWCRRALSALDPAEMGTAKELALQEALAMSSIYTWGDSKEVRAAIEHGLGLAAALGDARRRLNLLANLNVFLTRRGDFSGALAAAHTSSEVAEESGGATEKLMAAWMLGASHHLAGDQAAALRNCRLGFSLAATASKQFNLFYEARARFSLARSLWLSGLPAQGRKCAQDTIREMARYSHHFSYCVTLVFATPVLIWARDYAAAEQPIATAISLASKYSLSTFHALGLALKGELNVLSGDAAVGVDMLREAREAMLTDQYLIALSATSRALAEGLARSGRPAEALITIDNALERSEQIQEMWLSDLLRTKGEILLAMPQPHPGEAEHCLIRAIEVARQQSAMGWELKAALPLARLWAEGGMTARARTMLEALCDRFTEGFGTPDLADARRLLSQFGQVSHDQR